MRAFRDCDKSDGHRFRPGAGRNHCYRHQAGRGAHRCAHLHLGHRHGETDRQRLERDHRCARFRAERNLLSERNEHDEIEHSRRAFGRTQSFPGSTGSRIHGWNLQPAPGICPRPSARPGRGRSAAGSTGDLLRSQCDSGVHQFPVDSSVP